MKRMNVLTSFILTFAILCGTYGSSSAVCAYAKSTPTPTPTTDSSDYEDSYFLEPHEDFESPVTVDTTECGLIEIQSDLFEYVNDNTPFFDPEEKDSLYEFEVYSDLDEFGRTGGAYALLSKDMMPDSPRGDISEITPSGWHSYIYEDLIVNRFLYNRSHLIGYQLGGDDDERNLFTGTDNLNCYGMLNFEDTVARYILESGNHVLYRVTPVYQGDNLLADGVLMEAFSVEDNGKGINFCVFVYNTQPGVGIDYATGESVRSDDIMLIDADEVEEQEYVCNTNTHRFHYPWCSSVNEMRAHNRTDVVSTREDLIDLGFVPCGRCHP